MQITELKIFSADIAAQKKFYTQVLDFQLKKETSQSISLKIGHSILTIEKGKTNPAYHFAFNIPSNQAKEALYWLQKRVKILKNEQEEIIYFDAWQAEAIYFYDADQNLVEFIARKTLKKPSLKKFSRDSVLAISEIGLVCTELQKEFDILNLCTKFEIYSGNFERFCAIGNEEGLIVGINKNKKDYWFPTNEKAHIADFELKVIQNQKYFKITYLQHHFKIIGLEPNY